MNLRQLSLLAAASALTLLSACTTRAEKIEAHEDFLASSGFTPIPADTPQRQQLLAQLPEHRFATDQRNGKTLFVYPDSEVCHCLYVGKAEAFEKYKNSMQLAEVDKTQLADRTQLHRQTLDTYNFEVYALQSQYAAWDWGPWGYGGW
jgi:hypothetical protein